LCRWNEHRWDAQDLLDTESAGDHTLNWKNTRKLVWDRDGGTCQVCKRKIEYENYECGHVIDRARGGSDDSSNLVLMCGACNVHKPLHSTVEEYKEWVSSGFWESEALQHLRDTGFSEENVQRVKSIFELERKDGIMYITKSFGRH
jgi:5-methylcytosine-specific restriction protein A